ncbi:site-specific DNA-methyltransferase [Sphingobium sp. H39-3-25]|uniref:DNA-methyltransferase n=1 Tax=Sphingomonadales TaxID=204457 RepID=UPI0009FD44E8|nr:MULTISPECIES: site-specific DNA-methyltransferase [Sphingomonadaceae]MDF0491116.1 site-specific DNA-methyltransferase [Sphingomonas pollutisoli]MDF0545152.1 site-specific DNA-methyltransferase [Sphingobium arseniciresistens]
MAAKFRLPPLNTGDSPGTAIRSAILLTGDCREQMPARGPFDLIIADPPYGDTSLSWDRQVEGWLMLARAALRPTGSIWIFGSLRSFLRIAPALHKARLRLAQDVIWQKQNGTSFHADRFRRVHEIVAQFYRTDTPWRLVHNAVRTTPDATARTVRRKTRPPHMGDIGVGHYRSLDGGPRLMRSVLVVRNCHGRAIHPTEKPVELLETLIETSCPPGGLVGDWFAGSGAVGEACLRTGRRYLGCEIDPAMAERARLRLQGFAAFYPEDGDD